LDWIIYRLVLCTIVGIVFGTYPVYKVAILAPIESLRYERFSSAGIAETAVLGFLPLSAATTIAE